MKTYIAALSFGLLALTCSTVHAQRVTVTVAGNGDMGFNGDGNAGIYTELDNPYDVCVDAAQNIYFSEDYSRIRKLSVKNGIITTVAGGGASTADGVPPDLSAVKFCQL